jgi:hypothetical protein
VDANMDMATVVALESLFLFVVIRIIEIEFPWVWREGGRRICGSD